MKIPHVGRALLVAVLFCSVLNAQTPVPPVRADERVLCAFEHTLSYVRTSGIKGAMVTKDSAAKTLQVTFPKADTGAGISVLRGPVRMDPIPYLSDPAPGVEITFRTQNQPAPESLYVILETADLSTKPSVGKRLKTQVVPISAATRTPEGWQVIRLPFENLNVVNLMEDSPSGSASRRIRVGTENPPLEITSKDAIERVQILGGSAGALEIAKVSLVRSRNLSVRIENPYAENMRRLEIAGETGAPSAQVTLKLVDAAGKTYSQTVQASGGKYRYTWETPPLSAQKPNFLQATVGSGKTVLDQAVPREVFGFLPDTSHAWLKVKGREIVTSPLAKDGEQPFISVGAGYGKDVIVRGYDEEVAKYARDMGLNTLRLAFYTTHFNGKADLPLSFEDIIAFIDPVLEAAKRHGLYVILDDHGYFKNEIDEEQARGEQKSAAWTEERFNLWVARWAQVADHYKNDPYVLGYELCNEPVCSPETARKWYQRCRDAIRKVDQSHIIIVGTHNWSHARAMEATWSGIGNTFDAPYDNAVFSFHDYPLDNNPWEVQAYLKAFQDKYNVPVMCTEFGGGGKPEPIHREFQTGMLSLFALERIPWMIWALSYDPERATGFPTDARKTVDKKWEVVPSPNPGYYIPYVELWAPAARIMGSPFPEPAGNASAR
jgi:hypothetical protein